MNVDYLIQVLERKLIILNNGKAQAFAVGDLDTLNAVDQELLSVQSTLTQLNLLATVNQAAAAGNMTTADMIGTITSQVTTQGPSASAIVNGYDISSYATDALYEQKIETILSNMPAFGTPTDLDTYIQTMAQGSPVTGQMIFDAASSYNVDMPLLIAIMQNDSEFGTQGVGATTFNPGNVGNTGYATQTYASWSDGVTAVAAWLNNHRVAVATTDVAPPVPVETTDIPSVTTDAQDTSSSTEDTAPVVVSPPPTIPVNSSDTSASTTSTSTPASTATSTDSTASSTPDTSIPVVTDTDSGTSTATTTSP